jgi:hypothetical protein
VGMSDTSWHSFENQSESDLIASGLPLYADFSLHASFLNSGNESGVIAFGLVGICLSEGGNGLVERIALAQVTADLCWVTRTASTTSTCHRC